MKLFALLTGCVLATILFVYMLTRIDSGGIAVLVGLVFGMLAAVPSVLLLLASQRKPTDDGDDYDDYRAVQRGRPALGQPFPYQPPIIVLAAPVEGEPQSVTVRGAASSVPTVYDRQRQIAAQGKPQVFKAGLNGQGARVFRVQDDWDE